MGQACCGGLMRRLRPGGRRQYRHNKGYDFAPKRSWKYKDANLLSPEDDMEASGGLASAGVSPANSAGHSGQRELSQLSSVEDREDDDRPSRMRSGLLSFQNDSISNSSSGDEDQGYQTTPIHAVGSTYSPIDSRERTESNVSEQIGRFEIMDVIEDNNVGVVTKVSGETSKLLSPTEHVHSDHSTDALLAV